MALARTTSQRHLRHLILPFVAFVAMSCDGNDPENPELTTVAVTLSPATIMVGETAEAAATGLDQNGDAIALGTVSWSSSATAMATVDADGNVTGVEPGTTEIVATVDGKTGQQTLTVVAPPALVFNEIESNGGTPGDWVELYNPTAAAVDLSGWVFKDNDDTHTYTLPASTTIAAGAYLVLEEADFGFGLGGADAARLFTPSGISVTSHSWTAHAATTYGRCPDATGDFTTTLSSTKGTANGCPGVSATLPWPGSNDVQTVDGVSVFGSNLSGLTYEWGGVGSSAVPTVLWAVQNGPGTLFRLIWNGTIWTPDPNNDWAAGKALHYTNGMGNPDTEGVTFTTSSSAGIYVSTERNNDASTVSRTSVLRFDLSGTGTSLTATNEWNLTSDLPVLGANLGLEAITWVPDAFLVSKGFFDETAGHAYNPAEYADHGDGLFFVGVEGNGNIYVYALNHTTNGFTRIATIASGYAGVMGMEFDRELEYLWVTCDDGCGNKSRTLEIDTRVGFSTSGKFVATHEFDRPTGMPNINNEGFAITPQAECSGGQKFVFWSDDGETGGHSIRQSTIPCTRFP